ncbi:hypothetical protein Ctob_015981 [Chrysochromulina tobinii]|uniref:Uncharacterized protein n=1 Tax=Chrysochromulina tobinii TaxID=1460289 RepID=A0A0M0K4E4_9EUKA|nr:hypothetical protein Ctob_015981 [Chrysochromulina tobinii]|eukprot:KOO33447.1 hypothetical protein Ctob_015981 [Chrysochromulina sp. CCMP291]
MPTVPTDHPNPHHRSSVHRPERCTAASLAASSAGAEAAAAASFSQADSLCILITHNPIAVRDHRPERSTGVVGGVIGRNGGGGGCLLLRRQLPASAPFECAAGSEQHAPSSSGLRRSASLEALLPSASGKASRRSLPQQARRRTTRARASEALHGRASCPRRPPIPSFAASSAGTVRGRPPPPVNCCHQPWTHDRLRSWHP